MKNFTRPEGEKPHYFSTTVEDGKVISHEGDMEHAVYSSETIEISRRAGLWHAWIDKNVKDAYNNLGIIDHDVYADNKEVCRQFMDGERSE